VLESAGAALVWADRDSRRITPLWRTADWGYLRLHAGRAHPAPRYGPRALATWTQRVVNTFPDHAHMFIYLNNDPGGAAVADARALQRRFARAGRDVRSGPTDEWDRPPRATAGHGGCRA
jgi:uncharacterized protein YecE (DUF72 family)